MIALDMQLKTAMKNVNFNPKHSYNYIVLVIIQSKNLNLRWSGKF